MQPLSAPLQSGNRFLPHLLPAALSRNLTTPLAACKAAGQRAYHVSQREPTSGVGRVSSPVVQQLRRGSSEPAGPDHVPFWSRPVSIVGLFSMTAFNNASPGLTLPPHPRPRSPDAGDRHGPSRFRDLERPSQAECRCRGYEKLAHPLFQPGRSQRIHCPESSAPPRCQGRTSR